MMVLLHCCKLFWKRIREQIRESINEKPQRESIVIEIYPNLYIGDQNYYDLEVKYQDDWLIVHTCKEPYYRQVIGAREQHKLDDKPGGRAKFTRCKSLSRRRPLFARSALLQPNVAAYSHRLNGRLLRFRLGNKGTRVGRVARSGVIDKLSQRLAV